MLNKSFSLIMVLSVLSTSVMSDCFTEADLAATRLQRLKHLKSGKLSGLSYSYSFWGEDGRKEEFKDIPITYKSTQLLKPDHDGIKHTVGGFLTGAGLGILTGAIANAISLIGRSEVYGDRADKVSRIIFTAPIAVGAVTGAVLAGGVDGNKKERMIQLSSITKLYLEDAPNLIKMSGEENQNYKNEIETNQLSEFLEADKQVKIIFKRQISDMIRKVVPELEFETEKNINLRILQSFGELNKKTKYCKKLNNGKGFNLVSKNLSE